MPNTTFPPRSLSTNPVYVEGVDYVALRRHLVPLKERSGELDVLGEQLRGVLQVIRAGRPEAEWRRTEEVFLHICGLVKAIRS